MTINDLLDKSKIHGVDLRDYEFLLAHMLGWSRERVIAHPEATVTPNCAARFRRLMARRRQGEPLPHLLGEAWFYGRPFRVSRGVLIPRPETEQLIELAVARARKLMTHGSRLTAFDLGAGSGCIAITLATELPHVRVIAIDVSPAALRVARANARQHGVAQHIVFRQGNLLQPLLRDFSTRLRLGRNDNDSVEGLIIANLPYLTTTEWRALPPEIKKYEPRSALDGGPDGLAPFRELFAQLPQFCVHRSAFCILEIDPRRKTALTKLVRRMLPDWRMTWHRDLAGRWRVLDLARPKHKKPAA
ncbi:MAG: peptide chain release factor N(5)-glutamine methyltransferase [Candidatus Uhrbacteria bacterium]